MKRINTIIESNTQPKGNNTLWIKSKEGGGKELKLGNDTIGSAEEVITVDITGCTIYDEDDMLFTIREDKPIVKAQILDWVKSKAKFLRLTFEYGGKYGSALFTKDAISNADSSEYYTGGFNVISSIMFMDGDVYYMIVFNLNIRPSEEYVSFKVYRIEYAVPM